MVAAAGTLDTVQPVFEHLFVTEYERVVSVAFRITRDRAEAEDIAQEVFLRFSRLTRPRYDAAAGWLYRVAVNLALNSVRTRRRRSAREARLWRLQQALPPSHAGRDPADVTQREDTASRVRAALGRLKKAEAAVLALRYADLSYREIAQTLAIDERQIGTRLARAERALKRELERETLE